MRPGALFRRIAICLFFACASAIAWGEGLGRPASDTATLKYGADSLYVFFYRRLAAPMPESDMRPATDLWIREVGAGREIPVVEEAVVVDADLSADGRLLAYATEKGECRVLNLPSLRQVGRPIGLVSGGLSWSHEGDLLLMVRNGPDGRETSVFVWNAKNEALRRLTDEGGANDRAVWSPDDRRVLFVSGRTGIASLWQMNADGSAQVQITNKGLRSGTGTRPHGFVPVPIRGREVRWENSDVVTYPTGEGECRVDLRTGRAECREEGAK